MKFVEQVVQLLRSCNRIALEQFEHGDYILFDRQPSEDGGFLRQISQAAERAPVEGQSGYVLAIEKNMAGVHPQ